MSGFQSIPCFAFRMRGSCVRGADCQYRHDPHTDESEGGGLTLGSGTGPGFASPLPVLPDEGSTASDGGTEGTVDVELESDIRRWQSTLGHHKPDSVFKEALRLSQIDEETCQRVVDTFAKDKGLNKVRQLVQRDFACMSATNIQRFCDTSFYLFVIITSQEAICSAVLEDALAVIHQTILGEDGQNGEALFEALARHFPSLVPLDRAVKLEATLAVLAQLTENSCQNSHFRWVEATTVRMQSLNPGKSDPSAEEFAALVDFYAERILSRIHIAKSAWTVSSLNRRVGLSGKPGPGRSETGHPRHDNDHKSIVDISILPTSGEIQSTHEPYLPPRDPSKWFKDGADGLLDRHFRLLRQDALGPVCCSLQAELQKLRGSSLGARTRQEMAHTISYHSPQILHPRFHDQRGPEFDLSFDQPVDMRNMSLRDRELWWNASRRMQGDFLLCLLSSSGALVFCTVSEPSEWEKLRRDQLRRERRIQQPEASLFRDARRAQVVARPVVAKDTVALLNEFAPTTPGRTRCLLEFPGVLIPGFMPTLTGIQTLAKKHDLPFAKLISPRIPGTAKSIDTTRVPSPAYAQNPQFKFDLRAITRGAVGLKFSPRSLDGSVVNALTKQSSLDRSQSSALLQSLSRSFALIQGPPGTGKSFTAIAILKVLLGHRSTSQLGPLLCVCYTNHALDQLLDKLLDRGLERLVRIGSGSKSERVSKVTLATLSKNTKRTKTEKEQGKVLRPRTAQEINSIRSLLLQLSHAHTPQSIKQWLERSHRHHADQLFGAASKNGTPQPSAQNAQAVLNRWLNSGSAAATSSRRDVSVLARASIWSLPRSERQALHQHWVSQMSGPIAANLETRLNRLHDLQTKSARIRAQVNLRVLNRADVIGVTTSGLARSLDMLRDLKSKVMLVEEAGEVLESHLLTALLPSIEHAILIGDHQQLRPRCQYDLSMGSNNGKQYAMDQSLFERLVTPVEKEYPKLPYSQLHVQRRMHPDISRLIRSTLYPGLVDGPLKYPPVAGMTKRLFWLDHHVREQDQKAGSISRSNDYEVEMVAGLVTHLVKQEVYGAGDIAVLTPYLAQLRKLEARMQHMVDVIIDERDVADLRSRGMGNTAPGSDTSRSSQAGAVRIATVDNFQGEEAKVVVISLVRSNPEQSVGFLATSNRINVLLSRAKHGMYIIGDSSAPQYVEMWHKVLKIMRETDSIGETLEINCARHSGMVLQVRRPVDFEKLAPNGGCTLPCGDALQCGHACEATCHSSTAHDKAICYKPCNRPMHGCLHSCGKVCHQPCPERCTRLIIDANIKLPCGHVKASALCHEAQKPGTIVCKDFTEHTVPACGHTISLPCGIAFDPKGHPCPNGCEAVTDSPCLAPQETGPNMTDDIIAIMVWFADAFVPLAQRVLVFPQLTAATLMKLPSNSLLLDGDRYRQMAELELAIGGEAQDVFLLHKDIIALCETTRKKLGSFWAAYAGVDPLDSSSLSDDRPAPKNKAFKNVAETAVGILLLRFEVAVFASILSVPDSVVHLDLTQQRNKCTLLLVRARTSDHILQMAEALVLWTQFAALEIFWERFRKEWYGEGREGQAGSSADEVHPGNRSSTRKSLDPVLFERLTTATGLCRTHTDILAGFEENEIQGTSNMLIHGGPNLPKAVGLQKTIANMAALSAAGHWCRCGNRHPFVSGAGSKRCPECGSTELVELRAPERAATPQKGEARSESGSGGIDVESLIGDDEGQYEILVDTAEGEVEEDKGEMQAVGQDEARLVAMFEGLEL